MRVLLINKFHYRKGGAERAYFDTARILSENGHTVACFAMEHPDNLSSPWSRYFVSQVDYLDEGQSLWSKLRAAFGIVWNFEAARKLEQLIVDFNPTVAHLHNTYHQLSPSILWVLRRHHIPIVMTLHDYKAVSPNYSLFVRGKLWLHTSFWRTLADRAIKDSYAKSLVCAVEVWFHRLIGSFALVDRYIAPSRFLIETYRKLGFPHAITHVPQPLSPFPSVPMSYGRGAYYLFAGRLSAEKGVETLLKAFSALPDAELVIAGTGPLEAKLRKEYRELPNVRFLGHLTGEPLQEVFREAKAFIIPSEWYENMPYSLLEALGYGLPVIGSRLGGITERIEDGKNGFLFEAGNVADLISSIERCKRSDRAILGQQAWDSVQDLREDKYYTALKSIYQQLTESPKR